MKLITHKLNIKKNGKEIYSILHQHNGFNQAYVLPEDTYIKLDTLINNNDIGMKTALNYLDILIRIDCNYKTNKTAFKNITYDYIALRANLIENNIIKISKEFQRVYDEEKGIWGGTPNEYELITKDRENCVFIFVDSGEEENISVTILDELDRNPVIKKTLENTQLDWRNAIIAEYHYVRNNTTTHGEYIDKFTSRVNTIFKAKSNRMMKKGPNVNRIYSTFTMLSGIARGYLHVDGEYFHSIDLRNAQPTLFTSLCSEENITIDKNYKKDVGNGVFYDNLIDHAKKMFKEKRIKSLKDTVYSSKKKKKILHLEDRDEVKELCYRGLFFYQNNKLKIWKVFKDLYPLTASALINISKDEKLATKLQNMEASIFHKVQLDTDYFIVHDAIYFTKIDEYNSINSQLFDLLREKGVKKHDLSFKNANDVPRHTDSDTEGIIEQMPVIDRNIILYDNMNSKRKHVKPHKDHKCHNFELRNEIMELHLLGIKPKDIHSLIKDRYDVALKTVYNNVSKIKKEIKLRA